VNEIDDGTRFEYNFFLGDWSRFGLWLSDQVGSDSTRLDVRRLGGFFNEGSGRGFKNIRSVGLSL
jgi:hypothetical protein